MAWNSYQLGVETSFPQPKEEKYEALNPQNDSNNDAMDNDDEDMADDLPQGPDFDPLRCLFCNLMSTDLDKNLYHMLKSHGLVIPDQDRLLGGVETLLGYFHLVIFGYYECLFCGSQRHTVAGVQQHMRDKGHCKFDLEQEDSEYQDFYDEDEDEDEEMDDGQETSTALVHGHTATRSKEAVKVDQDTLRLPSGKLLSHRTARAPRKRQERELPEQAEKAESGNPESGNPGSGPESETQLVDTPSSTALTRAERRAQDFTQRSLAHLREADRRSLVHLPLTEQRAVLARRTQQLDAVRRAERAQRAHVDRMGNATRMKHFVNDVPGRRNG